MEARQAQLQDELRQAEECARTENIWCQHNENQAELDNLYNSTFAGLTHEYPEHEHARANFDVMSNAANEAYRQSQIANRVLKCLVDADNCFKQARNEMGEAKTMSSMDMLGGGAMASAAKREDMNRAQRSLMMAEGCVFEAHTLNPQVRVMNQLDVGAQGSGMTDIFLDNVFTDFRVNDEIKMSIANLAKQHDRIFVAGSAGEAELGSEAQELNGAARRKADDDGSCKR